MVTIRELFDTEQEASLWASQYLQNYHPCGYGTRLDPPTRHGRQWLVRGSRSHSCD